MAERKHEIITSYGDRVFIENGEVKTILSESVQNNDGDMSLDQFQELLLSEMHMIYQYELSKK